MQSLRLPVEEGASIAVRRYLPEGTPHASVVIGGAMGVRQAFYEPFARWLAGQGVSVWTFDYRGVGDSLAATSLRDVDADLMDWARDYEAVIDAAKAALPQAPLYLLGHSLGAQLPGFLERPQQVDGLISIAAGSGYWRENAPRLKRSILYFWFVLVPLATRLWGYFPGRRLRKVGDLPRGVILQWRRWCLDPRYSVGAEGEAAARSYARVRFPVLALSMTDDELMTFEGTRSLLSLYPAAPQSLQRIAPADVQARRIGHFGFFREQFSQSLWPRLIGQLQQLRDLAAAQQPDVTHTTAHRMA
ncbi:alpha/beta fold hydrolase [Variovorax dokdonensis]|uniref:Alpha/beta fold hydrolase n=1 Tax=Variovorax dokdonensis TaxID=344883 RepID=A0ABT7NB92_9BURK|nr:alpha/beta fold hydrolase [Variovorax dokdonensis]MDM0045183.1 alpha/beta fold hydrolase [Variovorax dokdonensis]